MTRPVVVIGAGLGGLVAAARLATRGKPVILLERLNRIGGVSGEWQCDGATYVRGSVEFMGGFYRGLERIGIGLPIHPVRARYHFGDQTLTLPPRLQELPFWARALPGTLSAALALGRSADGSLADALVGRSQAARTFLACFLQQGGLRFSDIQAADARSMVGHAREDGLHQPAIVEGGPQRLVDALAELGRQRGVQLRLGEELLKVEPGRVETRSGPIEVEAVLSSRPRWQDWTGPSTPGLALGQVLLWLHEIPPFPDGLDSLYRLPVDVDRWHAALTAGDWPPELGWSLVNPRLGPEPERRTLVGYLPVPAGADPAGILERLLAAMERLVPGLNRSIRAAKLLLPPEYRAIHGLAPTPIPSFPTGASRRPSYKNQETGELHMGTSVEPPSLYGAAVVRRALAIAEELP